MLSDCTSPTSGQTRKGRTEIEIPSDMVVALNSRNDANVEGRGSGNVTGSRDSLAVDLPANGPQKEDHYGTKSNCSLDWHT